MKLVNLKLLTIICEPILSPAILAMSQKLGATGFTTTEVSGQGTGDKNSGEIPDSKIKIELIVETHLAEDLMRSLSEMYFKSYSLITYSTDILVLRPEKFGAK